MDDRTAKLLLQAGWVHQLTRRLVKDEHLAADIAQDTLVVGLARRDTTTPDNRGWLAGIARRLAVHAARRRRHRELSELVTARRADDDPERRADERLRLHELLSRAVRELPEPYRTAVALRFFDNLAPRAIARQRRQTAAAVRQQVHRGLLMLRARLDREYGERDAWLVPFAALLRQPRWLPARPSPTTVAVLVAAAALAVVVLTAWSAHRAAADGEPPAPVAPEAEPPPQALAPSVPETFARDHSALGAGPQDPRGHPDPATLTARVEAYLQPLVRMNLFAGSVLVAQGGRVLLQKGYGSADVAAGTANSPSTRFKLMSTSKTVTAVATLRLVQQGRLALRDPVGKHLGDWPAAWREVTVHDLLDHTSGIPNLETAWTQAERTAKVRGLPAWPAFLATLQPPPLASRPGTAAAYSNFNFELLGLVVERVGGQPFRSFVQREVLEPAGMRDTGFDDGSRAEGLAVGCCRGRDGAPEPSQQDMSVIQAAGGLWSTVGDLYRFDRALRSDALLGEAARRQLFAPRQGTYACGFETAPIHGHACLHHSGGANGYVANFLRFPDDDACVVVLSNFAFAPITRISGDLAALLFGIAVPMPVAVAASELEDCCGLYGTGQHRLLLRRLGDSLLAFDSWPGSERLGGRALIPLGHGRFTSAMGDAEYRFEGGKVATPYDELPRAAAGEAAWRQRLGRFRLEPAIGAEAELVAVGDGLQLQIRGGWPAVVELAPLGADRAIGLVAVDFGTLLQSDGERLRWTRADGAAVVLTPMR